MYVMYVLKAIIPCFKAFAQNTAMAIDIGASLIPAFQYNMEHIIPFFSPTTRSYSILQLLKNYLYNDMFCLCFLHCCNLLVPTQTPAKILTKTSLQGVCK